MNGQLLKNPLLAVLFVFPTSNDFSFEVKF